MEEKRSWWQQLKQHRVASVLIALFVVLSVLVIFGGYKFNWDWTGFNRPSKSLWDWLQLLGVLAVPVVVGFGAVWFTTRQGKVAAAENTDNQRETALQAYIDKISELLLHEKLRDSEKTDDEVRNVARVQTLTVLRGLDPIRKASVLQFLYESGLIKKGGRIIDLRGANLSEAILSEAILSEASLSFADLSGAVLRITNLIGANLDWTTLIGADLSEAVLESANLSGADLSRANLSGANLSKTILFGAVLSSANLSKADLSEADLSRANLSRANLSGANLTGAILERANLKGATMPDGSIHP
jgi:uncharacterized protein YjbI with pentapeptide repeats